MVQEEGWPHLAVSFETNYVINLLSTLSFPGFICCTMANVRQVFLINEGFLGSELVNIIFNII